MPAGDALPKPFRLNHQSVSDTSYIHSVVDDFAGHVMISWLSQCGQLTFLASVAFL
ncbi:MAG: hypothetical protein QX190_16175 [Methylococcales bacterium]